MDSNIFSRIAEVLFVYHLTLIFILKIKVLAFFLMCEYLATAGKIANNSIAIR